VLDDPTRNSVEYLEKCAIELSGLSDEELTKLGEQGKVHKDEEDAKEVKELRKKNHVY